MPAEIRLFRCRSDNYGVLLHDPQSGTTAAIDAPEAAPIEAALKASGWKLTDILVTHHHGDHTGGNRQLLQRFPGITVYGGLGDRGRIAGQSVFLDEGDEITVCGAKARILAVPGHTKAHIAYFFAAADGSGDLFSGDTVFGGTIGNMFEGTPEVMFESIRKIRALPRQTR